MQKNMAYDNGFIYKNGNLKFFGQPEGYVEPNGNGGFTYVYQYKDQLGNIRLSYKNMGAANNPDLTIVEENNYYPFGLKHKGYNNAVSGEENPYKYNGKELNAELGLDWYDYGARFYDAAIGRFTSVDPKAAKRSAWSPYNYVQDNPLNRVDPSGTLDESVQNPDDIRFRDKDGNLLATFHIDPKIIDADVYLPFHSKVAPNVNLNKYMGGTDKKLSDIDVLGIGGNWDYTAVMGGGYSVEALFFLDGKNKGKWQIYETNRQNIGVNGSYGAYFMAADYTGEKGDVNMTFSDYTGPSYAISGGFKVSVPGKNKNISLGGSMFWSSKKPASENKFGTKSLFNSQKRAWTGYTVDIIGSGGGFQYSIQNTRKWENRKYFKH